MPSKCKKPHMYRVFWFESDEGGGDRREHSRVRACNIQDVIGHIKKTEFKPEFHKAINVDSDGKFAVLDVYEPAEGEEEDSIIVEGRTEGFQIEEDDDLEPEFKTIFGTNDFVDLSKGRARRAKDWNKKLSRIAKHGTGQQLGDALLADIQEYQERVRKGQPGR